MVRVSLDFETTSIANLKKVGAPRYAEDESTRVLCVAWSVDGAPPECWIIGDKRPAQLYALARIPWAIFTAWGAAFERNIWHHAFTRQLFVLPEIPIDRWRCTMTRALVHGLPRSLDAAGDALGVRTRKDKLGAQLMLKMSKPRRDGQWQHEVEPELLQPLARYCMTDVMAEQAVARRLPETPGDIELDWRLNLKMNGRGLMIDQELVDRLLVLAASKKAQLHNELAGLTGGQVQSSDQRDRLLCWLHNQGASIPALDRKTIAEHMQSTLPDPVRRALQIRLDASRTSPAKLQAMKAAAMADGRVRDPVMFYAAHTGRMSGAGGGNLQVQNFVKGALPKHVNLADVLDTMLDADATVEDVEDDAEVDGLAAVASALRACIVAGPGAELVACDFNAIEARVLAWVSGHAELVATFASGADVYLRAADEAGAPGDRALGKVIVLSLGYSMGWNRFLSNALAAGIDMDEEEAQRIVYGWRDANKPIVELWKALDSAARTLAVTVGEAGITVGRYLVMRRRGDIVTMRLPSGRTLTYRNMRIEDDPASPVGSSIVYDGARLGRMMPIRTFGGSLTENAVQAISYDLLAHSLRRLDVCGAPLSWTVHDEIVAETHACRARSLLNLMTAVMSVPPDWAAGLPLAAKGWHGHRYRKD